MDPKLLLVFDIFDFGVVNEYLLFFFLLKRVVLCDLFLGTSSRLLRVIKFLKESDFPL